MSRSIQRSGIGEFFAHLKRSAASASLQVIELNPFRLKLSQYDPETDEFVKKPLGQRWHEWEWGRTGIEVQRDIMSAFLACYADNDKGHDRALLLSKWPAVEALLRVSGLCRHKPCAINASLPNKAPKKVLKRIRKCRKMQPNRCKIHEAQGQSPKLDLGNGEEV